MVLNIKTCATCGESLHKNNDGYDDCPQCNIENFLFRNPSFDRKWGDGEIKKKNVLEEKEEIILEEE